MTHLIRPDSDAFNFHRVTFTLQTVSVAYEIFVAKKRLTSGQLFKKQLMFDDIKTNQLPFKSPISF